MNKSETKTVLIETITNIGKIWNLNLQQREVKDVFRINTRNPENKTVILELVSVITKDTILKAFKNYNKGPGKLTTENLKISGPPKPIFIAENLTAKMKRLFYLARVFANSNDYKYCWSSNGKIFIRARDGSPYYIIRAEADLENLNQSKWLVLISLTCMLYFFSLQLSFTDLLRPTVIVAHCIRCYILFKTNVKYMHTSIFQHCIIHSHSRIIPTNLTNIIISTSTIILLQIKRSVFIFTHIGSNFRLLLNIMSIGLFNCLYSSGHLFHKFYGRPF